MTFYKVKAFLCHHGFKIWTNENTEVALMEACGGVTAEKVEGWFRHTGYIWNPWLWLRIYCITKVWSTMCYDSFTYFSPLIFLIYSLHAPASCLSFLVYILISFYRLSFLLCTALLFMHSLMHSMITHAQSCTVCLLMCSLLRHSLITQYIRTG